MTNQITADQIKAYIAARPTKARFLTPKKAIQQLSKKIRHKKANHLALDAIALLPQPDQDAINRRLALRGLPHAVKK